MRLSGAFPYAPVALQEGFLGGTTPDQHYAELHQEPAYEPIYIPEPPPVVPGYMTPRPDGFRIGALPPLTAHAAGEFDRPPTHPRGV